MATIVVGNSGMPVSGDPNMPPSNPSPAPPYPMNSFYPLFTRIRHHKKKKHKKKAHK